MMIKTLFTIILTTTSLVLAQPDSLAEQINDSTGAFKLGKIEVKGKKLSSDNLTSQINSKKMEKHNITNVGQALNALPGISISTIGARYETGANIRGFDLRQVPLYLDGIPQYVPYDGYVDLGRFTTFDLSEIRVEKGYSSVLYGPNAMGGAINLVTRKPVHKFEFDGMIGTRGYKKDATELNWLPLISGNLFSMNFGSRISDKLYITAGASGLYLDSYNLSEDFKATAYQLSGVRNQSYHRDAKASAKIGFTPNKGSEYALSYMYQHGEKGGPLYAGPDASVKPRYWRWPYWDKQSVYLYSRTSLGEAAYFKGTLFYDQFKNSLYSYDDTSYQTFKKPYAFKSWYDDYSIGAGVEAGTGMIPYNDMRIASHYKRDFHSELNSNDTSKSPTAFLFADETKRYYIDHTFDIGLEDGVKLISNRLSLNAGLSFDHRQSERADNYFKYHYSKVQGSTVFIPDSIAPFDQSKTSAFNVQARAGYDIIDGHSVTFSVARKTRFPTIKDRYSYKLGTAYPNPDLNPEIASHFELGYSLKLDFPISSIIAQCNIFYSRLDDAIQSVTVNAIAPETGTKTKMQNVGEAEIPGFELALDYTILKNILLVKDLNLNTSYSYADKKNKTDPTVKFTDIPVQKSLVSLTWSPIERSYIIGTFEWNSDRWVDSEGTRKLPGYHLFNLKGCAGITSNWTLEMGINNIADENYSVQEGYPEEGRTFFANMRVNFSSK